MSMSHPSYDYAAVTPNNSVDLPGGQARAFYIGGAGSIVLRDSAGDDVTFVAVNSGSILPVSAKRVLASGTTATNIVALY